MKKETKKIKDLGSWTKKEFESLPSVKWNDDVGEFDSLIILPTKHTHDSGYKCMDFVTVLNDVPVNRISGGSDVVHLGGIGGLGYDWINKYGGVPIKTKPTAWHIDCLKKSKLLRIFTNNKLRAGNALSSFELYEIDE